MTYQPPQGPGPYGSGPQPYGPPGQYPGPAGYPSGQQGAAQPGASGPQVGGDYGATQIGQPIMVPATPPTAPLGSDAYASAPIPQPYGAWVPPQQPRKNKGTVIALSLAAVLLLAVGGVGVAGWQLGWFSGDKEKGPLALSVEASAPDSFGPNKSKMSGKSISSEAMSRMASAAAGSISDGKVSGDARGLYGGSTSMLTCDGGGIVDFLDGDSARRGAFAAVEGIQTADVDDYVLSLTSVVVVHDTWVTDHAFVDDKAEPVQAVLQAGSAVLVDARGVPRVRCAGSSPLTEPIDGEVSLSSADDTWQGYSGDAVVRVQPVATEIGEFEVSDIDSAESTITMPRGIFKADLSGTWVSTASWNTDKSVTLQNDSAVTFKGVLKYGASDDPTKSCILDLVETGRNGNVVRAEMTSRSKRTNCDTYTAEFTFEGDTLKMNMTSSNADDLTFRKE